MLRYTITEENYLDMSRYLLKKRRGETKTAVLKLMLKTVVQMTAAAFLIFRNDTGVAPWMKWVLGSLSLLWALLSLFQFFFVDTRAKMLLSQAKNSQDAADFWKEHRLEQSGNVLRLSFGSRKLELPLAEISEIGETESLYLIFRGRDVFELVPKSAADGAAWDGFREELLGSRREAKKEKLEDMRASLLAEAAFAARLSLSPEELAKELARMKRQSLCYACGWSGFMIFTLAFPLVLAIYSAAAGSWPTFGLCMLAFVLFNFRLFIIFTPSYEKLILDRLPEADEEGYLLAVKDRTVYFLGAEGGTTYALSGLKKKVTDTDGLFLFFEKQNMLFVPKNVSDAFQLAAGLKKSIRARAEVPGAVQEEDEAAEEQETAQRE